MIKKRLVLFLGVFVFFSLFGIVSAHNGPHYDCSDSQSLVYGQCTPISPNTCSELKSTIEANCNGHYILQSDIDCSGETISPICSGGYQGYFDGDGHVINGLKIYEPSGINVGLFSEVRQDSSLGGGSSNIHGIIWNLGLTDFNVTGMENVGALVGHLNWYGFVYNSYSTGNVYGYMGTGGKWTGGLVGKVSSSSEVTNSYSSAYVEGWAGTGGLVGHLWASNALINNSFANGTVYGNYYTGGLAGRSEVSYASPIQNSYSSSVVNGNSDTGGLVGLTYQETPIGSFWDTETSGQSTSDGGIGKTTAEMQSETTFSGSGWDFNDIWTIDEGSSYPYLGPIGPVGPSDFSTCVSCLNAGQDYYWCEYDNECQNAPGNCYMNSQSNDITACSGYIEPPSSYDQCSTCIDDGGYAWCNNFPQGDSCEADWVDCSALGGQPATNSASCPIYYDQCTDCISDGNTWCLETDNHCENVNSCTDSSFETTNLNDCYGYPDAPDITLTPELLWTDLDGEDITGNTISMGVSTLPQSVNVVYQDTLLNMPQTFTILEYDLIGGYKEVGTVDATSDAENYLNGTLTIDLALLSAAGNEARYEFYFEINGTRSEILRINTDELPVTHWKDSQGNDYAENNRYDLDRDYLISNSITLQMYYLNGDGTETFDLYANGHYIDSYDSSLVASSAYDWAPTCEQLSAIGANEQNFDFYFETAAEPNPSATLEVRFDEAIPDSCQLAEEEILFDVNVCSDYPNQAYCEADSKGVAQNSKESVDPNKRLGCFWDGSTCGTRVISSYGGADIGNCSYIEDTSSDPDKCDNNFLTYTWTAVWNWAFPLNYYNSLNDCELDNTPGTCVEDPDISGRFYYDPIGARSDCQNGEATISCPAKVALDFFSLKNLFAAIILIVAIYLIMDRYKKPTKKKSTKKKVVKKK